MTKLLYALALSAVVYPAAAQADDRLGSSTLPVAYASLSQGHNRQAVAEIQAQKGISESDPSRLINLGTAYARLGRTVDATRMFEAAIKTDIRYDLELADGTLMDSRAAARLALKRLRTQVLASR